MKKIRNFLKTLKLNYYSRMMDVCAENSEIAHIEFREESEENQMWLQRFNYYSRKYQETLKEIK